MIVKAVKTDRVLPGQFAIHEVLDKSLEQLSDKSVVVVTSKIISLCEGRVVPIGSINKEQLIEQESDYYLPSENSKYNYHFSIIDKTLIAAAGIDESNGDGNYVLWPKDLQTSVNSIRKHLREKFGLKDLGVIISDSTCMPLRRGTLGIALAYSGFEPVKNYIGLPDLFNRPFEVSRAGIANGLAATAVLAMGEGTEQTPIVILEDLGFVNFLDRDPTPEDLEGFFLENMDEDLFEPFFKNAPWHKGQRHG